MLEGLITEQPNPASEHLDQLSTLDLLTVINREDQTIASAVAAEIPRITQAVDAIVERYRRGGRLFYIGAGSSGRLGVLDAAECPPTFGSEPGRVEGVIAGGSGALERAAEGSEDQASQGAADLKDRSFGAGDVLVGISASGRAPYVLGALAHAKSLGALTAGLSANPDSDLARAADIAITPLTGPEVLTGSTRMKAGTAQKLVLNMISTAVMVKMGYVLGNLMVKVRLGNNKLIERGRRIVAQVARCDAGQAAQALVAADNDVRVAIIAVRLGLDAAAARGRLADAGDHLGDALNESPRGATAQDITQGQPLNRPAGID